MKLRMKLEKLADAPRANGGKSRTPALGWSNTGLDGTGVVHVVRPFNVVFFALGRKVHECAHLLLDLGNDELHGGHTWHLCARSWHAIRLFPRLHVPPAVVEAALDLRDDGQEVVVDA